MKNREFFIDSPIKTVAIIVVWWIFWITVANFRTRYLAPDLVTICTLLYILGLILPLLIIQPLLGKINFSKEFVSIKEIKYPLFYLQLTFIVSFLIFICIPKMIENFFAYRLNIYFDDAKGIKSIIYPNAFSQLLFDIVFYHLSLAFLLIATFIGNKKLFARAAILLFLYSLVTMSRGLYLTMLLFYLMQPHIKHKLLKFMLLVVALLVVIPDYIEYNTIGFSLLEKFVVDNNLFNPLNYRPERFSSLGGFLWPIYSLLRVFIPDFQTGFEAITVTNSNFVDIGRVDEIYYNAFFTHLISPIYDLGFFGPLVLGFLTTGLIIIFSLSNNRFISRIFVGYIFYISMSGNTMNFLTDRMIIPLVIVTLVLSRNFKTI